MKAPLPAIVVELQMPAGVVSQRYTTGLPEYALERLRRYARICSREREGVVFVHSDGREVSYESLRRMAGA